jgi:hypothetical protein
VLGLDAKCPNVLFELLQRGFSLFIYKLEKTSSFLVIVDLQFWLTRNILADTNPNFAMDVEAIQ